MKSESKKVLVLHNILTPYRVFLFNKMNEYYKEVNIKFKVIFLSESDKNRHWKNFDIQFDYEILQNRAIRVGRKDLFTFFINNNINSLLHRENPDKIICFGWDHLACYVSLFWSGKNKKQFILWSGSTANEKSWRRTIFNPLVKWVVKKTDICVGDGSRHFDYLIQLGANPKNVTTFLLQTDIDYLKTKADLFTSEEKNKLKLNLGICTQRIILFNGQLIERKGIFELLEGFRICQQQDKDISLLFLGRGQEKLKMQQIIEEKNIQNVFFEDFVQYEEVYKYFAISDLFILPSREEAWGLVINEAMACGLPVITTNKVGACDDLIEEGKNGYVIEHNCPECIAEGIKKVFQNNLHLKNSSNQVVFKFDIPKMILKAPFLKL